MYSFLMSSLGLDYRCCVCRICIMEVGLVVCNNRRVTRSLDIVASSTSQSCARHGKQIKTPVVGPCWSSDHHGCTHSIRVCLYIGHNGWLGVCVCHCSIGYFNRSHRCLFLMGKETTGSSCCHVRAQLLPTKLTTVLHRPGRFQTLPSSSLSLSYHSFGGQQFS